MSTFCYFCRYVYSILTSKPIVMYEQVPFDLDDHVQEEFAEDFERERLISSQIEMTLSPYVTAESSETEDNETNETTENENETTANETKEDKTRADTDADIDADTDTDKDVNKNSNDSENEDDEEYSAEEL